ncbi:MAG: PEP-utilizing enzyme, partial [Candidatus Bathyarchaeia archaeon]
IWGTSKLGKALAVFLGDESFPVEWGDKPLYPWIFPSVEEEKKLFYMRSDAHHPLIWTPLQEDVFTCWEQHIVENPGRSALWYFDRYWPPNGMAWIVRRAGGRCYHAILPPPDHMVPAREKFYNTVIGAYADHAVEIWDRLREKSKKNLEYLDSVEWDKLSIPEAMIVFQDALDIHSEHWNYHWYVNVSYYAMLAMFNEKWKEILKEPVDERIAGDLSISLQDANWDRLKGIYELKEEIKKSSKLSNIFKKPISSTQMIEELKKTDEGKKFFDRVMKFLKTYGWMSPYVHQLQVESFYERPEYFMEQLKFYYETDFNYARAHEDAAKTVEKAKKDFLEKVEKKKLPAKEKEEILKWYERVLKMASINPDHHFYYDQGSQTRLGYICRELGKKLVHAGILEDPSDVFYLRYYELKTIVADSKAFDAKKLTKERRRKLEAEYRKTPYLGWFGTATEWAMTKEFWRNYWGWDINRVKEFEQIREVIVGKRAPPKLIKGIPTGTPVAEGPAKIVLTADDFKKVEKGDVAIAIMTSPAWGPLLPRLKGLVTDSGTAMAHPAIISRAWGIACVVGTRMGTLVIKDG